MYTTSERNSEVQVEEAKKYFKEAGIETVIKGFHQPTIFKIQPKA